MSYHSSPFPLTAEQAVLTIPHTLQPYAAVFKVRDGAQGDGARTGASNMRALLKKAYPHVKFKARLQRYAGGCSLHISGICWDDTQVALLQQELEALIVPFKSVSTAISLDDSVIYDRAYNAFREAYGGFSYVYTRIALASPAERARKTARILKASIKPAQEKPALLARRRL